MENHIRLLTPFVAIPFFFYFLLTTLPQSHCKDDDKFWACRSEPSCGSLTNMPYPFWSSIVKRPSYCGRDGFELKCEPSEPHPLIQMSSQYFEVLFINTSSYTMRIVRTDMASGHICSWKRNQMTDISLSTNLFRFAQSVRNYTLFSGCQTEIPTKQKISCPNEYDIGKFVFYLEDNLLSKYPQLESCSFQFRVPISWNIDALRTGDDDALKTALLLGFDVLYFADGELCKTCIDSNGMCGSEANNQSKFSCHCRSGRDALTCPRSHPQNRKIIIIVGGAIGALLICITILCSRSKLPVLRGFRNTNKTDQDIEASIRNHVPLAPRRYKFSDIKQMTNSFKSKLGQGGFGAVYKGTLPTGCPVAVKILNRSKGNGEEFINEVASIGRTSHVNVVTLLGFCLEGRKKALIYEFMPNGSLEKFIYHRAAETIPSLTWENVYQIAIGIARGLEYLHRGCNTRIVHFDIKPHNILLDENFCPKISDFGLAKLCPRTESIISMSDARGTLGYVAPEVWNRSFGGVSHKSDVYSYGMMLLEMVGGRKNLNAEASHTSEIYFPHWVYNNLEVGGDLGLDRITTKEENDIAKRMTIVGLWCIQTIPNYRPTITRVIEMLERRMDSLEMPPKPVWSSPTRSSEPE